MSSERASSRGRVNNANGGMSRRWEEAVAKRTGGSLTLSSLRFARLHSDAEEWFLPARIPGSSTVEHSAVNFTVTVDSAPFSPDIGHQKQAKLDPSLTSRY